MFNQSNKTVAMDGSNLPALFGNCSHSTLTKIISKYRADFLLYGYHQTLDALNNLATVKKTEEENKENWEILIL